LNYYRKKVTNAGAPALNTLQEYLHAYLEYDRSFVLGRNGVSISSSFIPADTPL